MDKNQVYRLHIIIVHLLKNMLKNGLTNTRNNMKTLFKIVWMIVFFGLSILGFIKTIQLDNTYEPFKWCCFAAMGITISILIFWSLIYKYFE